MPHVLTQAAIACTSKQTQMMAHNHHQQAWNRQSRNLRGSATSRSTAETTTIPTIKHATSSQHPNIHCNKSLHLAIVSSSKPSNNKSNHQINQLQCSQLIFQWPVCPTKNPVERWRSSHSKYLIQRQVDQKYGDVTIKVWKLKNRR